MRMLIQTQLSSITREGRFDLATDSGYQMVMGRCRAMLKLDPDLRIDVMCPHAKDCVLSPYDLSSDLIKKFGGKLNFLHHTILPNALATRFDFNFDDLNLLLSTNKMKYDIVYLNDPLHLRNFKALFNAMGHRPKFVVHSHFIDNKSRPKFKLWAGTENEEISPLWHGQVEAAIGADLNFWQCESAMDIFFNEMSHDYSKTLLEEVIEKSHASDDGYSSEEINVYPDDSKIRIDQERFYDAIAQTKQHPEGKVVLFVPNRFGDNENYYTNVWRFMFNVLPELRKLRDDFIVICGCSSKRLSNEQLESTLGQHGYFSVVPDSLNRDEYKWIAKNSDIVGAFYSDDSFGGTASRECIDLGMMPLWLDNYEYSTISREANYPREFIANPDFSDLAQAASRLIDHVKLGKQGDDWNRLQKVVRKRSSYEETMEKAYALMKGLFNE